MYFPIFDTFAKYYLWSNIFFSRVFFFFAFESSRRLITQIIYEVVGGKIGDLIARQEGAIMFKFTVKLNHASYVTF